MFQPIFHSLSALQLWRNCPRIAIILNQADVAAYLRSIGAPNDAPPPRCRCSNKNLFVSPLLAGGWPNPYRFAAAATAAPQSAIPRSGTLCQSATASARAAVIYSPTHSLSRGVSIAPVASPQHPRITKRAHALLLNLPNWQAREAETRPPANTPPDSS